MIKSLLLPILLIGIAVGVVFSYTVPGYTKLQKTRSEKAAYEDALTQGKEVIRLRDELESQYQSFSEEDRLKLQKLLPDNENTIDAIVETDDIATDNGVMLTSISDGTEKSGRSQESAMSAKDLKTTHITYQFTATDYESFNNFLKSLEQSLHITDIGSLTFSTVPENGEETTSSPGVMNFTMGTDSYWLSE